MKVDVGRYVKFKYNDDINVKQIQDSVSKINIKDVITPDSPVGKLIMYKEIGTKLKGYDVKDNIINIEILDIWEG